MSVAHIPRGAELLLAANFAKLTVILLLVWGAGRVLATRSAAQRHQVWTVAVVLALVMPFVGPMVPAWHADALAHAVARFGAANAAHGGASGSIPATSVSATYGSPHPDWAGLVFWIWAAGCVVLLLRLAAGFAYVAVVGKRSTPVFEADWIRDVIRVSSMLGISRAVRVMKSRNQDAMPLTWGVFRPRVLIPAAALEWSAERREIVLRHELAHVARMDCLWQVLGEVMRAAYWCHPLAWLAVGQLRRESEHACDDSVLNAGVQASGYADHLLELARTLNGQQRAWLPALAMARHTNLERRFSAMFNPSIDRRTPSRSFKRLAALAGLLVLLPLAALRLPAQNESGKVGGTIYDPSGAAIPNATIIMIGKTADTRDMTSSGTSGTFEFAKLPPGQYEMEVLKPGFKAYTLTGVSLEPGRDFSKDVTLDLGSVEENLEVKGNQRAGQSSDSRPSGVNENPQRIRIGGNVQQAQLFTQVMPVYPQDAKADGVQGTVVLHAVIGKDGNPLSLRVVNGEIDPRLAKSAVEAVSHWRYRPTLLNGDPVEVDTTISVGYHLYN